MNKPKQRERTLVALACSDWHFWHKPPVARSAEEDWYAAMLRPVEQLKKLSCVMEKKDGGGFSYADTPIICAGDVFDKWNPNPELVNWCIKHMPVVYAVPGQHDLCHHSYADVRKTAYWTLVEAGKIIHLRTGKPVEVTSRGSILRLHGFPWGKEIKPLSKDATNALAIDIAVVHKYVWDSEATKYSGAAEEASVSVLRKKLKGYDVSVFGDNHKRFLRYLKWNDGRTTTLLNCGAFMKRKQDERDYEPSVGLIYSDGSVERAPLDCSQDKFTDVDEMFGEAFRSVTGLQTFIDELCSLGDHALDFGEAVRQVLKQGTVEEGVKSIILTALENGRKDR